MRGWLARSFEYLLLAPALLPLIFFDGLLYPYLTPKTLFLRAVALLVLAAFVVLALSGRSFHTARLKHWGAWIPAALLALAYLSSLLGVDFHQSFWSRFDRGDGLLTLSALSALFYGYLLTADAAFMRRLLALAAFTAGLVALLGTLQWVQGLSGMDIPLVPPTSGRVGSTLGNAAFLASYLGMTLFVTLAILPSLKGRLRTAAWVSAALHVLAILGSATRGTLLALIAASALALAYTAWRGSVPVRTYARAGFVGLVIFVAMFFMFRDTLQHVPFAPVQRIASISLREATVESRLFLWENISREALKHPLGVGAEHIQVLFNRVYDPTKIAEQWFDRTHNAFLDYVAQYGVLGLALFLALLAAFLAESYRLMRSRDEYEARTGTCMTLLLIVYAIQNFFVFDTVSTLWLLFALFAMLLTRRDTRPPTVLITRRVPSVVARGAGVLIALLIIPVSLMPLRANLLLADGYTYHLYDVRRSVASIEKGYALGTYANLEYGYQLYEMYTERQSTRLSGEERLMAYRTARDILAKNMEEIPYDARTAVYYAHVLDLAPPEDRPDEDLQRDVIAHAIELSPKRIQPHYLLANISIRKGDELPPGSLEKRAFYEEAIAELAAYGEAVPQFAEPKYIIATLYLTLGDVERASEWAAEGLAVYKPDVNTARRAARYYVTIEDWERARRFLTDIVHVESEDYPIMYDLAKTEFLLGNVERAKEIVATLRQKAPGLVETDQNFLNALGE